MEMLERDASGRSRRVEPTFPRQPSCQTESSEGSIVSARDRSMLPWEKRDF